jgi:TP901 family phage tail tape measure protein
MGVDRSLFEKDKGLQELFKKNEDAANNLQVALDKLNEEIGEYGDKVTSQQSKGKLLTDGLREYTTVIGTAEKQTFKLVQTLNKSNEALSRSQMEAKEAADAAKDLATAFRSIEDEGVSKRRLDIAAQAAGGAGYAEKDLKSITTQHPSGVTFFKYEMEDAMGVTQKYEVVLDKFGKELTRTNRRLLGFAESVKKNTIELIKWSVGVTLVYGTYYKFQQLLETAIDNQAKLAVVAVTLGNAQRDLNEIFDDAAKVAAATGESINAILETYTFAYRAVGAIADPIERTAKANQLLTDATILNKMSSLDAASSIDVLAGSLRQLQGPTESVAEAFDYGVDLLDKWVVTTRNANVDLASLSMAFSVTAESAMNAGMSVEELNAVIASLAEKIGGLGGRETGNAVRALIGGVYQQQATDILAKYGIAVKNTAGQMRDFLEISRDIYELYDQDIISASELNKIGLVLGGGVRRGQQYVAYLSDFGNVLELVEKQSNSSGASQQALGIIMETLQVTLTKLSNSVQNLAQTMGTEGGLLGAANSVLGIIIKLVDATDTLVGLFGKLTIPAALLGMGAGYFSLGGSIGAARRTDFSGKIGGATQGMMSGMMGMLPYFNRSDLQNIKPVIVDGKIESYMKSPSGIIALPPGVSGDERVTGAQTLPAQAGAFMQENYWGMMPGMFAGISRLGEEDYAGAAITMGATMGGAWAKGPWGAIVGTIIAEVFIDGIRKAKADLTDALVSPLIEYEEGKKEEPDLGELEARREINTQQIMDAVGLPIALQIGAMFADLDAKIYQAFGAEGAPVLGPQEGFFDITREKAGYIEPGIKADEYARLALELREKEYAILKETGGYISTVTEANHLRNRALLEEADLLSSRSLTPVSAEKSSFALEMRKLNEDFGTYLNELSVEFQKQLRVKMTQGETTTKEFQTGLAVSQGARPNVLAIQAALSVASGIAELVGEGEKLPVTKENMKEFFDLVTQASPEVVTTLTQMTSEIVSLSSGLDALEGQEATATVNLKGIDWTAEQLIESIVTLLKEIPIYAEFAEESLRKMNLAALGAPKTIMSGFEGLDPNQLRMVIEEALDIQEFQLQAQVDIDATDKWTQEWKDATIETAEPLFIYLGELFGFQLAEGISKSEYLQEALLNMQESMRIPEMDVGYRFFDVSQAQMNAIMPQYDAIRQSILAAGGTSTESALLAFFQNSSSPVYMQKDWAIIQMLLSALLRTNTRQLKTNRDQLKAEEKQLEGIYNLPGGASFYVPFDAYAMKYKGEGEEGLGLEEPVQEFAAAVEKMDSILDQYKNYNVEAIQSMREFMDGWGDWVTEEEVVKPTVPEVAAYDVEGIQSLIDVDIPKEPFKTYVTNIREFFTKENLLQLITGAIQAGEYGEPGGFGQQAKGVEDPKDVIDKLGEILDWHAGGMGIPPKEIDESTTLIEKIILENEPLITAILNLIDTIKNEIIIGGEDSAGGMGVPSEVQIPKGSGVELDELAGILSTLKGIGGDVESGVSKGMSELETKVTAGLSPTKTSLDSLVATLSHESERGYNVESIQSLMGDALSGGTITLSDVNFTTPDVSTKLNMSIQVNTQLTLDGYMLWQGIKDYARADLVTYGGVSGSASTTYVI